MTGVAALPGEEIEKESVMQSPIAEPSNEGCVVDTNAMWGTCKPWIFVGPLTRSGHLWLTLAPFIAYFRLPVQVVDTKAEAKDTSMLGCSRISSYFL